MSTFYVSGPMAGYADHNHPAFHKAAAELRAIGHTVVNPAELNPLPVTHSREECLRRDIAGMVTCDAIALLPGWENSEGAAVELHIAESLGMVVVYWGDAFAGPSLRQLQSSLDALTRLCHEDSRDRGWWDDPKYGSMRDNPLGFSNKISLVHAELSEALEGDRKQIMDNHITEFKSTEAELADAAIRIFDLCGAYKLRLGEALVAKRNYNQTRKDHSAVARAQADGKRY